jgi:hypothetical protein
MQKGRDSNAMYLYHTCVEGSEFAESVLRVTFRHILKALTKNDSTCYVCLSIHIHGAT